MASKWKRVKLEEDQIIDIDALPKFILSELSRTLFRLCSIENIFKLIPYKFENSNASIDNGGVSFSKAYCDLKYYDKAFYLGDIFRKGIDFGLDFLDHGGRMPREKHEILLLEKLFSFLKQDEEVDVNFENETDLTAVLANHLFGKLAISQYYTIDKNCKTKKKNKKCSCGHEDCCLTGAYGDTSIGNPEVWHGSVDIIIGNDLVIDSLKEEPESPGGKSPAEVKMKGSALSRSPQLTAETIVFSFLQKSRHPERTHFLTPCIGIGNNELMLMFYDSEHDVLMESSVIPLTRENEKKFSVEAIMVTWLTVNYKFLCSGLTEEMIPYKANFFEQAKGRLKLYQNELKMTNVGVAYEKEKPVPLDNIYSTFLLKQKDRAEEVLRKNYFKIQEEKM